MAGSKEPELHCYKNLLELAENDLEDLRSSISALADENTQLKKKLKEVESQAQLSENNVNHQHGAKDLRAELRKLKEAYKTLSSEKEKEISSLLAEKSFVWNQLNTREEEYRAIIKSKDKELKQATEVAQKKDGEISRLRAEVDNAKAEVVSTKEKVLILEDELEQLHSVIKGRDAGTDKHKDDQPETSQKFKNDLNETNRKSKSEVLLREKSRISQVTPVRREVKTSRRCVSSAKAVQNQSRNNSRMHNKEERGHSEARQKRKRGSSSLSYGPRRCSTRVQVKTAVSPMLFTPCFTIPKLSAKTPPQP